MLWILLICLIFGGLGLSAGPCGVLKWERNAAKAEKLCLDLRELGEKAVCVTDYDFAEYEILFIPGAVDTPLELREALPKFLARGRHVILEGWPVRTFDGSRLAPEWGELLPGTTHCVMDSAPVFKGLHQRSGATVTLKAGPGYEKFLSAVKIPEVRRVSWRSMNKCQWRLTGPISAGRLEYHDCMDLTPVHVYNEQGKVVGQHTAVVRHFCSFFPGATVICADIQTDPSLSLLNSSYRNQYLKLLLHLARSPLPGEPGQKYLKNILELRRQITRLKLIYSENIYLFKDFYFHRENNLRLKLSASEDLSGEFLKLEKNTLRLCRQFAKFRFNRKDFAVKRKERILSEIRKIIREWTVFQAGIEKQIDRMQAVHKESRWTIPEKGQIDIKMSYGDYEPLSWGGAPGFTEYENGRAMAALGIDGTCSPNYVNRRAYCVPTAASMARDQGDLKVFEKYVQETGLRKFTSHELPTQMIPETFRRKVLQQDKPYVVDMRRKIFRPARSDRDLFARLGGCGIISSATEEKEFWDIIEYMARRAANVQGVHTRSITLEGMLMGGYSEYGFSEYRKFLKEKHGSLEKLNQAWNSSWKSFEDIRPPVQFHKTPQEHANHFDWVDFRSGRFLAFMRRVADIYRRYDSVHQLTACINQVSPLDAIEFQAFNEIVDFAAAHNTPTSSAWYQVGMACRNQRADNNEPKWISGSFPWNFSNAEEELQKCQRFNMINYAMQGMSQFAPYEWRHGNSARFAEGDGMLYLAGAEFKPFIKWKNKWQNMMGAVSPQDYAETGLFWSFVHKSQGRGGIVDAKLDQSLFCRYFGLMDAWNALLDQNQINYDTVTRNHFRKNLTGRFKIIIVPQAVHLEPTTMEQMLEYARSGGTLILEGMVGRFDQYRKEDGRIFDALGLVPLKTDCWTMMNGEELQPLLTLEDCSYDFITYEMIDPENIRILLKYQDGTPAAVEMKLGKGRVVCTGFSLTGTTRQPVRNRILDLPLRGRTAVSDQNDLRLFTWKGRNKFIYQAVLNRADLWRTVKIRFAGTVQEAYDLESGVKMNFSNREVQVPLFPAGARIVAVRLSEMEK